MKCESQKYFSGSQAPSSLAMTRQKKLKFEFHEWGSKVVSSVLNQGSSIMPGWNQSWENLKIWHIWWEVWMGVSSDFHSQESLNLLKVQKWPVCPVKSKKTIGKLPHWEPSLPLLDTRTMYRVKSQQNPPGDTLGLTRKKGTVSPSSLDLSNIKQATATRCAV